jgi:hypothetical protein
MKHTRNLSRMPAPAFYYQLTLMEKIEELATFASFVDSVAGEIKDFFPAEDS